ncbi:AbrB/MazE/SpoVT family DNA-binding domain-containing protein [Candidatus Woesearchaeota archaeon]|nr:AbrB/MazE/SpoVT family DNA-binding domain-containing protein [Candidatus Woesearchaeota archaeon]
MKRKVNRVGQNTLTVSLPAGWVREHGVKAGDEIEVVEEGSNLVLVRGERDKKLVRAVLNVDNLNKMLVNRHLQEFYRQGADEIVVKFTKETIPEYKTGKQVAVDKYLKKIVERFIGLEIVSQTKNKIVLQNLISEAEQEKLDVVQKRIYFLLKEFFDEFVAAMDGDFREFHAQTYSYHDNIAKFTAYYLRLLHMSDVPAELKARLFSLFTLVDKIVDKVRHTSERIEEAGRIPPKVKRYVKDIFNFYLSQFDIFLKKKCSVEDLEHIIKKRYTLLKKIESENFKLEELKVMTECKILLDTIVDFSETYVAMNMEGYVGDL